MARLFSNAGLSWRAPYKRQGTFDKEMSSFCEGGLAVTTKGSWWGEGTFWMVEDIEVEMPDKLTVWATKVGSWTRPCGSPGYDNSEEAAKTTVTSFLGGDLRRPTPDEESQVHSDLANKRLDVEEKERVEQRTGRRDRSPSKSVYNARQARERHDRLRSPSRSAAPSRSPSRSAAPSRSRGPVRPGGAPKHRAGVVRPSCAPERQAPRTPPVPPKVSLRGRDKDVSSGPPRRGRSPVRAQRTSATHSKETDMSWTDFNGGVTS